MRAKVATCLVASCILFAVGCNGDDGDGPGTDAGLSDTGGSDVAEADGPVADGPVADGPAADGPLEDATPVEDGPAVDASPADGPAGDTVDPDMAASDASVSDAMTMLPGCPTPCAEDQVCVDGTCSMAGPDKACGTSAFGSGLPANDGIFYVDGSYTGGTSDGSQTMPFTSIGEAMMAIPKNKKYTIAVAQGAYDESLTIGVRTASNGTQEEFSADLFCRCPDLVQITQPLTLKHLSRTLVVTIDGCTIAPAGFDGDAVTDWPGCPAGSETYGIHALGGFVDFHLLVQDSVIGGWCTGIYYSAEPNPVLESSLCVSRSRIVANVKGVEVKNAPATMISSPFEACQGSSENLTLIQSRVDHNRDYGVYTYDKARGIALKANVVERTGEVGSITTGEGYAIYLGDTDSANLNSNVIRDNHNRGVGMRNDQADVSFGIMLQDNLVSNNRGAGIALQKMQAATDIEITGNVVLATKTLQGEPGGDGIQVSVDGAVQYNVNISNNIVDASDRNGIFYDGVGGTIDGNTVSNSIGYGCLLQQSTATVGSNTWSGNSAGNVLQINNPVDLYGSLPVPLP